MVAGEWVSFWWYSPLRSSLLLLQAALLNPVGHTHKRHESRRDLAGKKGSRGETEAGAGLQGTKIYYMYVCKE